MRDCPSEGLLNIPSPELRYCPESRKARDKHMREVPAATPMLMSPVSAHPASHREVPEAEATAADGEA